MRWFALILFAAVVSTTWAEPDPKKYKSEVKNKASNASLTDDERKFLREVEAKFGIKADVPVESKNETVKTNGTSTAKAPYPAVIAIEIVNDTDSNGKGKKRTIDANLGYGYRTNNGYTYTYYGKQPQEKGKFMIYPYSQEDIPPAHPSHGSGGKYSTSSPNVEIQPSRAYELIEEDNSYQYNKPSSGSSSNYQNIKGLVSPPPPYANDGHEESTSPHTHPATLYTTYNGQDFSSLSGQFPMVMSNYLVDPSQLVKNPQYQSAGISQDYLRNHHGSQLDQRVVPVLVLRVPSSLLKKPTAELYSNAPQNYPVSHYLNSAYLQEIVNNYFKKIGYSYAPPVTAYQNSISAQVSTPAHTPNHGPQEYANPHVQHPSYTQAAYSGVQYSGVQPVMAKYPSTYSQQQYYVPQSQQAIYQQPEQQYEYTYQYVPQSEQSPQSYYVQPQYQHTQETSHGGQSEYSAAAGNVGSQAEYGSQVIHETAAPVSEYGTPAEQGTPRHAVSTVSHYDTSQSTQEYGAPKEHTVYIPKTSNGEHSTMKVYVPTFSSSQTPSSQYGHPNENVPKETLAYYPTPSSVTVPKYSTPVDAQSFYYQKHVSDDSSSELVLSENYPSKDHTLATVLPLNYKRDKKPNTVTVQTVSYVTPMPNLKYQSHYNIMVPQTVLRNPATEKVSYVNSHSIPYSQLVGHDYNPEQEYTVPSHYIPPVGKQKAPSYPRNYHSHPKRNVKPENKPERNSSTFKKQKERNDNKKSS